MDYMKPNAPSPDGNTIHKIASQTKVFTTFMLLKLRDAGLLTLEDSVMKRFPKFLLRSDPFGTNSQITLRNLASQLSGLPRESPCGLSLMPTPQCTETSDVWSLITKAVDPIWPPATLPSYSNLGFTILGRGLEGVANVPYERWIETIILQPLKMTSSGFNITNQIAAQMPTIPGTGNIPWQKITNLGWSNPAGQMFASVNDIAKFMMNIFHDKDDSVFLRSSVRESLTPQWNDFSGSQGFGLPYEMYFLDDLWVMTKGGDLPGFDSESLYVKELKLGVTMSTSMGYGIPPPLNVAFEALVIMAEALKEVIASQQATLIYPPPPQLVVSQIVGCYSATFFGMNETLHITAAANGELVMEGYPLYYRNQEPQGYLFQAGMDPSKNACVGDETAAGEGQYVIIVPVGETFVLQLPTLLGLDITLKKNC
jgi:CubicO group peptidase (beta-lactamase class C family)